MSGDVTAIVQGRKLPRSRLIEQFLTVSRLESGQIELRKQSVHPGQIARRTAELAQQRLNGAGFDLQLEIDEGLPTIHADDEAVMTLLVNLIDNAQKYSPNDQRIRLRVRAEGGEVIFEVEDHGIGISEGDQKRVFERFFQADQRLSRETEGCGLGLNIVKRLAEALGGTAEVDSEPGTGSTFRIRLPAE